MVAAIFTMAVFYASVCSASCAMGVCPGQVQQKASHDCDRMPSHHSDQSRHHSSGNPDCSEHQHPGLFVPKSANLQLLLSVVDHLDASTADVSAVYRLPAVFLNPAAVENAPPVISSVPLYEQISVLRL
jgi:hypothetical protein